MYVQVMLVYVRVYTAVKDCRLTGKGRPRATSADDDGMLLFRVVSHLADADSLHAFGPALSAVDMSAGIRQHMPACWTHGHCWKQI